MKQGLHQTTVSKPIQISGKEPFGGNIVDLSINPARADEGIFFSLPNGEKLEAKISNAQANRGAISLFSEAGYEVGHVEHILATLYAMGVDNAQIDLSFDAKNRGIIPNFDRREQELCEKLSSTGIDELDSTRTFYEPKADVAGGGLEIKQEGSNSFYLMVVTQYPKWGEKSAEIEITPHLYQKEVSSSRSYAKHKPHWLPMGLVDPIGSLIFRDIGKSHDFTPKSFLFPKPSKDLFEEDQRIYGFPDANEIACHGIVDRLGAFALLSNELGGRLINLSVYSNKSGHKNDIDFLSSEGYDAFSKVE